MALSREQKALRDAALLMGRKFGVGGSLWIVTRGTSGDGVTSAVTPTTVGTIAAFVRKVKPSQLAQALAGTAVPTASWKLAAEPGAPIAPATLAASNLQAEDVISSQEDAALRFMVRDIDTDAGYVQGILEALR